MTSLLRPVFSGHETFQCRHLWLKKGYDYIKTGKSFGDESAVVEGEVTGHYYFKDFYLCDSGIAPMLYVMDMLSKGDKKLDQLLDTLGETYFISGEINTKGVDGKAVLARIEEKYSPSAQEVLKVDGVSIIYPEWNFNVRTSNTEPLVRLNLEATSKALMEEKRDEVLAVIRA